MKLNKELDIGYLYQKIKDGFIVLDTEGDTTNEKPYWVYLAKIKYESMQVSDMNIGRISRAKEYHQLAMLKDINLPYSALDLSDEKAKNKLVKYFKENNLPVFIFGGGIDERLINNLTNNELNIDVYDAQRLVYQKIGKQVSLVKASNRFGIDFTQEKNNHNPKRDALATAQIIKEISENTIAY